jgi:hypothetical protein
MLARYYAGTDKMLQILQSPLTRSIAVTGKTNTQRNNKEEENGEKEINSRS